MRGVGRREEVVWELQGHKKGTPRGSCGSVGAVREGKIPSEAAVKALGR